MVVHWFWMWLMGILASVLSAGFIIIKYDVDRNLDIITKCEFKYSRHCVLVAIPENDKWILPNGSNLKR